MRLGGGIDSFMPQKKRKLLIADPSTTLIDAILTSKEASQYDIASAKTGPAALKKSKNSNLIF